MDELLEHYCGLLARVDEWFAACLSRFSADIACGRGCSHCCRGLFDITILDALLLRRGFDSLPPDVRRHVLRRVEERLSHIRRQWPEFGPPYILNCRPEEEWDRVMPDDDETPCVLLGPDGHCLLYAHRPMTCRLHGLPHVDCSGEVLHDEWCSLNFTTREPLGLTGLRHNFSELFSREGDLLRQGTSLLLGTPLSELDTLIPLALLLDYDRADWSRWFTTHSCSQHLPSP